AGGGAVPQAGGAMLLSDLQRPGSGDALPGAGRAALEGGCDILGAPAAGSRTASAALLLRRGCALPGQAVSAGGEGLGKRDAARQYARLRLCRAGGSQCAQRIGPVGAQ